MNPKAKKASRKFNNMEIIHSWIFRLPVMSTILILVIAVLLKSCNSTHWLSKNVSQCDEEWQEFVELNAQMPLEESLNTFYEKKEINIKGIFLDKLDKINSECESCDCPSETVIYLKVTKDNLSYFLNQGYVEYKN